MVTEPSLKKTAPRWIFVCGAVFVFVCAGLLVTQLHCRFLQQRIQNFLIHNDLESAEKALEKAGYDERFILFANDRKRIDLLAGDLAMRQTDKAQNIKELLAIAESADRKYRDVIKIQPLDIDGYTGLARSTTLLERLYPFVHNKPYPHDALSIYERLIELMPVNLYTYELLAKYYYSNNMFDEHTDAVSKAIGLYPPLYFQLKRQSFYSSSMHGVLKETAEKALEKDIFPHKAALVLADIAETEGDLNGAISYYFKARPTNVFEDNSNYYLQLGRLQIADRQLEKAFESFQSALKTDDKERQLKRIWNYFKREKLYEEFLKFVNQMKGNLGKEDVVKILKAECLIELQQFSLAKSLLVRISDSTYEAESNFLLANIAEKLEDWDTMELRSQRATVLDPNNSSYHMYFSRSLQKQKKYFSAEQAASNAINSLTQPNPWAYNHRAWLRWELKNYDSALADWERAIEISPDIASFYVNIARVREKEGQFNAAVKSLNKAIELQSDEQKYHVWLISLEAKLRENE